MKFIATSYLTPVEQVTLNTKLGMQISQGCLQLDRNKCKKNNDDMRCKTCPSNVAYYGKKITPKKISRNQANNAITNITWVQISTAEARFSNIRTFPCSSILAHHINILLENNRHNYLFFLFGMTSSIIVRKIHNHISNN